MPARWFRFALPFLLSIALAACQSMTAMPQKSLYDRLGGQTAITAVVDDFVANVAADNRINAFFEDLQKSLTKFKCRTRSRAICSWSSAR
jgi:hemoglobin